MRSEEELQGLGDPNGGGAKVGQHRWGWRSGWATPVRVQLSIRIHKKHVSNWFNSYMLEGMVRLGPYEIHDPHCAQ